MKRELAFFETLPGILLSLVVCAGLPVVPFLLWRRFTKDKAPRPVLAIALVSLGLFGAAFSLLMLFGPSAQEQPGVYILFVLWLVSSLGWLAVGIYAWNNTRLVDRYAELLAAHAPTTIDDLAGRMGRMDLSRMVAELSSIFESGVFGAYRFDAGTRWIERATPPADLAAPRITFVCPGCGATNASAAVVGGMAACDYCDRPYAAS